MKGRLTSYAQLVEILTRLPLLVRETRRRKGLTLRQAGEEAGLSFTTIGRVENGEDCSLANAVTLLRWIGGS